MNTWNRWRLGSDFIQMLNKFQRLPLQLNVEKTITALNKKKALKVKVAENETRYAANLKEKDEIISR